MKNASNIFILIAVFAIFSSFQVRAQQWLSPEYLQVEEGQAVSFSDIQKAFNNWSAERDLSKTKGWKRYKRWEWFYGQRLDNDGEIPSPSINWLEYYKFENNYPKPKGLKTANWLSLAPTSLPTSPDPYNLYGMGRINCIEFHPTDTNTIFVGASQGGVWKTTDDGQSWACITDNIPVMRISSIAIDPNNPEVIYIATGDIDYIGFPTISQGRITQYGIGILKSTDGGVTWNTTGLSFELTDQDFSLLRKIIVNPNDSNKLLAGGPAGMYRSDDAGISWTKTSSNLYIDIEPNPNNANVIYAATFRDAENPTSQRIYKSTNFGDTWNELTTGITNSVYRVELAAAPSDTSIVYAITTNVSGALHAFYKTIDAGATWVETATEPNVLGWADGGEFSDATGMEDNAGQGDYDLTLIVNPTNANKVYSGGVNMWGSSDGGVVWDLVSMWIRVFGESIHADQHSSAFNPLSGHFYQAGDGGLYKT
ncbi:MAG: hypothetical protein JXR58_00860, partial [Bacteroidales bacterium]|nr:hypothetical protein [Bacteroidales bacterium]